MLPCWVVQHDQWRSSSNSTCTCLAISSFLLRMVKHIACILRTLHRQLNMPCLSKIPQFTWRHHQGYVHMFQNFSSVRSSMFLNAVRYASHVEPCVICVVCRATVQVVRSWSYDLPPTSTSEQYQEAYQPSMHASGFDGREGVYMPDMQQRWYTGLLTMYYHACIRLWRARRSLHARYAAALMLLTATQLKCRESQFLHLLACCN